MWSNRSENDTQPDKIVQLSQEVLKAISQVIPSNDPLDKVDFDVVSYINSAFPTEQSLAGLADTISSVENQILDIDRSIREFVRDQTGSKNGSMDGVKTLERAQASIEALVAKVLDMKGRAEQSEAAVRDMTRDIRQLDTAKKNLTTAITTLNHLNMLVSGVEQMKVEVQKRQYENAANLLKGVGSVVEHFDRYHSIPEISQLCHKVAEIKKDLGDQISLEFRESFSQNGSVNIKQMSEACLVLDVLEPHVKHELLQWFVQVQLEEYTVLFAENEDNAWLDKIDKRFAWLKKHLIQFEERYVSIFPPQWDVSQRIAIQFCHKTRQDLSKVMKRRRREIDVKLLLTAIQKTVSFENLLFLRFGGHIIEDCETDFKNPFLTPAANDSKNPFLEPEPEPSPPRNMREKTTSSIPNKYLRIITQCYDPFLDIYIQSQDKNLEELIERFVTELRSNGFPTPQVPDANAIVLSNCADLFVFYKKCLVQCTQLSCGEPLLNLGHVFSKRLREYCTRILQANLPKLSVSSAPSMASVTTITRELREMNTAGLIQNFQSLLKEGETVRYSKHELFRVSCVLTTAEYCVETISQLEEKLKEKLDVLSSQFSMEGEKQLFLDVIDTSVTLLVQDLYAACEPVLSSMHKINWQLIETVGDQSSYISSITSQWKVTVPTVRDFLGTSRKYFVIFCQQFAKLFMNKFLSTLYKCKNISKTGAQQLLLDTQSLKSSLLDLPSIGLTVKRKPPDKYSKLIVTEMGRVEMILKIIMTPVEQIPSFVDHTLKLIPDCDLNEFIKLLDMKGIKKTDQGSLTDEFKQRYSSSNSHSTSVNTVFLGATSPSNDSNSNEGSRIKKLEKLIKKRL